MDAQELRNLQEAYMEVVMGEGKVPWNDPDHPLQSGHTPAEKNRAKRARTGVEDPNTPQYKISDKDMSRYSGMKEVDDTETSKSPKQKKTLLGKKKPLEHKTPPHKFKKERHVDNTSDNPYAKNSASRLSKPATHTKGQGRRVVGDKWDSTIAQTPIRSDDTRRRTPKKWGGPNPKKVDEQVDLYDIILSHLLDEGYAETPEAAEVIMVNMSEDWRESICEELTGERRKRELEKGTPLANRVATGREGQPVERRNRSGDIIMRTTTKAPTKRGGGGEKGERKADWSGWEADRGSGNKAARRAGKKVRDTSDEL